MMVRRLWTRLYIALALFSAFAILLMAFPAHTVAASPLAQQPFAITGAVTPIASPAAYRTSGAFFLNNSKISPSLTRIRYYVVHATLVKGVYQYPYHLTATPGIQVDGLEVAFNLKTHTQLLAVGELPVAPKISNKAVPYTSTKTATLHLIWHDPVNIWLAQTFDTMTWTYDGQRVDSYHVSNHEEWFGIDGWTELSHSYSNGYCRYATCAYDTTYADFYNGIFCSAGGGSATAIWVQPSSLGVSPTGGTTVTISTWATGGCTGLIGYFWKWG